jgi:hypothetical protein
MFDREFEVIRGTKQVQVIRRQQIVTDEPRRGGVLPDIMKRSLKKRLSQPASAMFGANCKKHPVRPPRRDFHAFGGSLTTGFPKKIFVHGNFV